MNDLERLRQSPLPFAALLGIEFTSAAPERVTAELIEHEAIDGQTFYKLIGRELPAIRNKESGVVAEEVNSRK